MDSPGEEPPPKRRKGDGSSKNTLLKMLQNLNELKFEKFLSATSANDEANYWKYFEEGIRPGAGVSGTDEEEDKLYAAWRKREEDAQKGKISRNLYRELSVVLT